MYFEALSATYRKESHSEIHCNIADWSDNESETTLGKLYM